MYSDDEMVMISALQHDVFCRRQCALIHLEQVWAENYLTASGRVLHEHVDTRGHATRRDIHTATAVRLFSRRLGLTGVADMLEFNRTDSETEDGVCVAVPLPGLSGFWRPYPVEYKRGKPKAHRADEVQLCAQAMCLEEMLDVTVPAGALFYGEPRRRVEVVFDAELRRLTQRTADDVHRLLSDGVTPLAEYTKACEACSIKEFCQPKSAASGKSARRWIERNLAEVTG